MSKVTENLEKRLKREKVKFKRRGESLKWHKTRRTAKCALCKRREGEKEEDQSFRGWAVMAHEGDENGKMPEICPDCLRDLGQNPASPTRTATCMKCGASQREKIFGIGFPGWKMPFLPPPGGLPDNQRIGNLLCPNCSIKMARKLGDKFVRDPWTTLAYVSGQLLTAAIMNQNQANFQAVAEGHVGAPEVILIQDGDRDTMIEVEQGADDDTIRFDVSAVEVLNVQAGTWVFNEQGNDVNFRWEGVGAPNALFVQGSDGKVGIGTGVIPHGGVGAALLALEGANASADGPFIQFTTVTDNYPLFQVCPYQHDIVSLFWDAYFDGANDLSSDAGSSFAITKQTDLLRIRYDVAAQGAVITWNNGIVLDTSGKVFINDTANAKALGPSLTIDGAGQGGEYLTLQDSTDVAHGMTTLTETDSFLNITKAENNLGGAIITGFSETTYALSMTGIVTSCDTAKNTNAIGAIYLYAAKKSGTTLGNLDADANVFTILARRGGASPCVFIVDEDGEILADGGVASTNMVTLYDDLEDAHLVRAFDIARSRGQLVRGQFDKFLKYNEDKLVELGILGDALANGGLTNVTRLQQLHNGAIWQNYCRTKTIEEKLEGYERAFEKLGISQKELLALTN